MDNLVEEINNFIQINRNVRLRNMIYNYLSAVHVRLLKLKETHHEKTETTKKHMYDSMEPVSKKRFLEDIKRNIQLWMLERRKDYFLNSMGN